MHLDFRVRVRFHPKRRKLTGADKLSLTRELADKLDAGESFASGNFYVSVLRKKPKPRKERVYII